MNKDRQSLIDELVDDLTPVEPRHLTTQIGVWFALSWLWVIGSTLALGPLRPGALDALTAVPHFGLESLLGLVAGGLLAGIALHQSTPGAANKGVNRVAWLLLGIWVASYLFGFVAPALEPSMLGKRPHCFAETWIYAAPPLVVGLWMLKRGYVLNPMRAGFLLGLAAGMMPALFMQIACMYAPAHILVFHLLPGSAMAIAGAGLGYWIWSRPNPSAQSPQ